MIRQKSLIFSLVLCVASALAPQHGFADDSSRVTVVEENDAGVFVVGSAGKDHGGVARERDNRFECGEVPPSGSKHFQYLFVIIYLYDQE